MICLGCFGTAFYSSSHIFKGPVFIVKLSRNIIQISKNNKRSNKKKRYSTTHYTILSNKILRFIFFVFEHIIFEFELTLNVH